jgi:hypothetical protein
MDRKASRKWDWMSHLKATTATSAQDEEAALAEDA